MPQSVVWYLGFLAVVGVSRLLELRLSRRNQTRMLNAGAQRARDPVYPWMVALHTGTLVACALEVILLSRTAPLWLAVCCLAVWAASNLLRAWVIKTLAVHWNTEVVDSTSIGVVSSGPYSVVRHPNYVAVFLEMLAIAGMHGAWLTLAVSGAAHILVLHRRIESEETVLLRNPEYQRVMAGKPRFLPGVW